MRYFCYALFFLFLIALLSWQTPHQDDWQLKVDQQLLLKSRQQSELDFMVVLKEQAQIAVDKTLSKEEKAQQVFEELQRTTARSQSPLIKLLKGKKIPYQKLCIVNALRVRGDRALLQELAKREEVAKIHDNSAIRVAELLPSRPNNQRDPRTLEWGIERVNANDVWAMGYRGEGVVIGAADTGYEWDHAALKSRYRGWNGSTVNHNYSWHDAIHELSPLHQYPNNDPSNNDCGLDVLTSCDDHGHGTWTMGIMVGEDGDNQIGMAPEAKWIGCRNMEWGYGAPFTYLECLEWFLAPTDLAGENPDPTKAPHVINNSWNCPEIEGCNSDNWNTIERAVDNLKAAGVFVAVSAGNDGREGCSSINAPATFFENSFTVGGLEKNDSIGDFSSRGPVMVDGSMRTKPNIAAPGRDIRSAKLNGGYSEGTGTSGAAPFVAGTVALMISANPDLAGQVDLLEDILEQTATPRLAAEDCGELSAVPNNFYGYGSLDALAAVERALTYVTTTEELTSSERLRVYPNPTRGHLTFELPDRAGLTLIELFDATGRRLYATQWAAGDGATKQLSLSAYPAGLYFYQLNTPHQLISGRLVKQ